MEPFPFTASLDDPANERGAWHGPGSPSANGPVGVLMKPIRKLSFSLLGRVLHTSVRSALLVLLLAGCKAGSQAESEPAAGRPVTAVQLSVTDPTMRVSFSGSVQPWKRQDVGFEVGGRVVYVVERGEEVTTATTDPAGVHTKGSVLAKLATKRYALHVASATAQARAIEAKAKAVRTETDEVLHQQLQAALAERSRARQNLERVEALVSKKVESPSTLDGAKAECAVREAKVKQIEAARKAKLAEWESLVAQVEQAEQAIQQAKADEADCALYAPFDGVVTEVHVIPGAFVQPGQPVVSLMVMDPLKIEVAVSPAIERTLRRGDTVEVYPCGLDQPRTGWVFQKDPVADSATRTFRVTILVRNLKVAVGLPADPAAAQLPRISETWPLLDGEPRWLGVELRAVASDERGHYLWKVEGGGARTSGDATSSSLARLRKVYVELGPRARDFMGLYTYRELTNAGGLKEGDLVAAAVPPGVQDGDRVVLADHRRLFRPGEVVRVKLNSQGAKPGLYVPMAAIIPEAGLHHVFVAEYAGERLHVARRRAVGLTGSVGDLRRIEGNKVAEGMLVVLDGAHYLVDGETVQVVGTREATH